jgi:hypothetical protein
MQGRRLRTLVVAGVLTASTGACSSDGGSDAVAPASTTSGVRTSTTVVTSTTGTPSTATTAPTSTTGGTGGVTTVTTGGGGLAGEVTVRATVASVFASARVLRFQAPVDGYSTAALAPDTEYRRADGSAGSLQDVNEGSTVEVTGAPGESGVVIARLVVVTG